MKSSMLSGTEMDSNRTWLEMSLDETLIAV